ncbi:lipopolysaccharide heptosyltransferase II [Botrimarina hoheduenensis]|uniref:lipopolysaccharide heptosyltransferase II n=1 Tax=Botrimarina hoheduenensis TaxID=2528000 RepID=A0A5C5VT36_9BACT|nr:lipopolysaccharide heptosyltransferase II [Botrimarina hoheduenensis]TWT40779.1 ADP-heptose--LPS heptosyltransferase 2 [Botrimarina hoheduenensis]
MRLGVFLPNWIGDVVMATPALDSLRELAGPEGRVVGVMRPYVADVLAGLETLDRHVFYKPRAKDRTLSGAAVIAALREERLDAVVLLTNSLRTAWLAWRSGASERIGYERDQRSWLLSTRLRDPRRRGKRAPLPQIDSYLNLAYAAGGAWRSPELRLATTPQDEAAADDAWSKLGLPQGERVVVFNTGGAYGDAKSWPAEHFAELARRLVADEGLAVVVNCGPGERETANRIAELAGSPAVVSLGRIDSLPIGLSKAIIRRSHLLVSTDSGPRFFGIAFGKPVVSLFGPTDPMATKTHYAHEERLSLALDCQFCWARECPLGHHNCMTELTVARVLRAVHAALDGRSAIVAA